jgi:hypothetical protein
LHLKFRARKIIATLEVLALPAFLPRIHVNAQFAGFLTRPNRVNADLKNFPNQRSPELEFLQVGIYVAKACLHVFLCSHLTEKLAPGASVFLEGAGA